MILVNNKSVKPLFCFFALLIMTCVHASSLKISDESIAALISLSQKNFEELDSSGSLANAHKALQHAYSSNNDILKAGAYNVIAKNYSEILEAERAIKVFNKAYALVKDTEEVRLKFDILTHLATLYKTSNAQQAISIYFNALDLNITQIPVHEVLLCKVNIVHAYYKLQKFDKGYIYLKSVEKEILKSNSSLLLMYYHILKAYYYDFKNDLKSSGKHYNEALKFVTDTQYMPQRNKHLIRVYYVLSMFYDKIKNKDQSYNFLKKYLDQRNSLQATGYYQAIIDYAYKIDGEEFERRITEVEQLNSEQKSIILYNRIIYSLFLLISIVLFVTVLFLVKSRRQKSELISKIKAQNKELDQARKELEKNTDLKTQFIGKVSHELRTPLYSVIGLTSLLEQDYAFLRNTQIIKGLKSSSDYLMNLINDLLQLQKIEANADKVEIKNYTINSEIEQIREGFNKNAILSNNKIEIAYCNELYKIVKTDKVKLNKIIYNLIGNALKYTKNGTITIQINQQKVDDKNINLEISIRDTGSGISADKLKSLFSDLNLIHSGEIDFVGSALGLPVVKKLVTLLGGTITVTSELDKGSIFCVTIPCKISKKSKLEATKSLIKEYNLGDLSILLVENNEINRIVNQRIFKNHDMRCTAVSSAQEAINLMATTSFDVVLTDISMPEMDGFEFTRYLRNKGIQIPIIALTAYDKADIIDRANECGLSDVITKPFELDFLLTSIYTCIQQTKKSLI